MIQPHKPAKPVRRVLARPPDDPPLAASAWLKCSFGGNRNSACTEGPKVRRLVWGFSCQGVVFGLSSLLCSERERAFLRERELIADRARGAAGQYLAWLLSLPTLERERLLGGNWKIRPAAGLFFKREWCAVVDQAPADLDIVRYWDLAATEKTEFNDPDWTVGVKLGRDRSGGYWLLDMVRARANPGDVGPGSSAVLDQDWRNSHANGGRSIFGWKPPPSASARVDRY